MELIQPKFKVGDWVIVSPTEGDRVVQIASVEYLNDGYPRYITTEGRWFGNGTKARLLTDKDVETITLPESKVIANQKPADKVKPKFKVGDKIYLKPEHRMPDDDTPIADTIHEIIAIDDKHYRFEGSFIFIEDQDKFELVNQNPAWSEEDERMLNHIIGLLEGLPNLHNWLKSIKDRVQPLPKQEWSEEDEEEFKIATETLREAGQYSSANWLKSLKPQTKQEWSQNDIDMIDWLIRCCEKEHEELCNDKYGHQDIVSDLKRDCRKKWDWLESLKNRIAPQNQWKPSEKQMNALDDVISSRDIKYDVLSELWKDLKQL